MNRGAESLCSIGMLYGIAALGAWGLLPLFWMHLAEVPSLEIIAHRIIWSFVFLLVVVLKQQSWQELRESIQSWRRSFLWLAGTGALIASNWLVFVWSVQHGRLSEVSLGYFISPLLSVALGRYVLREPLTPQRRYAIALAALGVVCKAASAGTLPWEGLFLAFTFSLYGLLRKRVQVSSLVGLTVETALLAPFALIYVLLLSRQGTGHFLSLGVSATVLLMTTGIATALPLLWFVQAARLLPLSTLGIIQYLSPTLQFVLAVTVFEESLSLSVLGSFCLIWLAIVLYLLAPRR
jgi:chloramphenicol-sensitive protein RarD